MSIWFSVLGIRDQNKLTSDWRSINAATNQNRCPALEVTVDTIGATFVEFSLVNSPDYQRVDLYYDNQVGSRIWDIVENRIQNIGQFVRIDGLKPNSHRSFTFRAFCVSGDTKHTEYLDTKEIDDCATVTNLRYTLTGNGQNSVMLEWDLPIDPPDYLLLKVIEKQLYSETTWWDTLTNTTQQKVLTGLKAGKEYTVEQYSRCGIERVTGPTITFTTNAMQPNSIIDPHVASALSVAVTPNPGSSVVKVMVNDAQNDEPPTNNDHHQLTTHISLIDAQGRALYHKTHHIKQDSYSLPLGSIPAGVYLVEVVRQQQRARVRFAVKH